MGGDSMGIGRLVKEITATVRVEVEVMGGRSRAIVPVLTGNV